MTAQDYLDAIERALEITDRDTVDHRAAKEAVARLRSVVEKYRPIIEFLQREPDPGPSQPDDPADLMVRLGWTRDVEIRPRLSPPMQRTVLRGPWKPVLEQEERHDG